VSAARRVVELVARCVEVGDELHLPARVAGGDRWAHVVDRPVVFRWSDDVAVVLVGVEGVHTGVVWYAIPLNEIVRVRQRVEVDA
jgi:hypothetical protein